jgi:hypothetical protein
MTSNTQLDNKIDNLVLQHGFGVDIGNEEGYVISLYK